MKDHVLNDILKNMKNLENLEKYYQNVPIELRRRLPPELFEITYKKGTRVLNYKQVQEAGLFLYKGSAMELSVNPITLEETASNFWFEGDFPYTTPGLFNREPSPSSIILLEDSSFVGIQFTDYLLLKSEFPEIEIIAENIRSHYSKLQKELGDDFRYPAKQRIERLEKLHPNIYNLAELKHIAQFHRVSTKTLSRLRG